MKTLVLIIFLWTPMMVLGQTQDIQNMSMLASQYYQDKEYGKAAELYEQLYNTTKSEGYLSIYLDCLIGIHDYDKAEKVIKKGLRGSSSDSYWYVQLGYVKKTEGQTEEASKLYDKAISALSNNPAGFQNLSNQFINRREFEYAEKVYIKARAGNPALYNFELARIYYYVRNYDLMLREYIEWAKQKESNIEIVKSSLQSVLAVDNDGEISKQMKSYILKRIQEEPSQTSYTRLLIWLFIQDKNFTAATRQAISLDKRTGLEDGNIFALANVSASNKNYDEALKAYDYLVGKGKKAEYYTMASQERMNMYYERFVDSNIQDLAVATELKEQFSKTFDILGVSAETTPLQTDYAHLLAFYLDQPAEAIKILTKGLTLSGINQQQMTLIKTELSDVYVYSGELWDAVITYSQVIESNKNNALGDDVKFKKARLGYYMGNFKWAKAQLDVLKASTSKLIANDAMELALFISENLETDSTATPLQLFARADLQLFRNHYTEAMAVLDSISKLYSSSSLMDDVDFRKASIFQKEGKYEEAAVLLASIVKDYSWGMLADDALFQLALIYENKLNRQQEAMDLFKKMLTDYPASVYVVDSRSEYRKLQETIKPNSLPDPAKTKDELLPDGKSANP